ncbi:phosphonate C-P lyase system protein PhnH [Virgibacillus ihumii]|uniref:phosphonate C-P lyase system protein PhnH n=1 Tax=Virgibacillus ihumii TaxID=2686091 RepID=UPI00157BF1FA|nr:phosphonate C-P lyase system protein PhnH [Virgibacillus ihumii]
MPVDYVHDLQNVYRELLDGLSRPGEIKVIKDSMETVDKDLPCFHSSFLTALTLLDGEVSFHIISKQQSKIAEKVSAYTMAKHVAPDEADFVFAFKDASEKEIVDVLNVCKFGDLENPQYAATWIIESESLSNSPGVTLKGPGIKKQMMLNTDCPLAVWAKRNEFRQEFPLGIDVIFVDKRARAACIPRSTIVENVPNMLD